MTPRPSLSWGFAAIIGTAIRVCMAWPLGEVSSLLSWLVILRSCARLWLAWRSARSSPINKTEAMADDPGRRRGRIITFLMSALKPVTTDRYAAALCAFSSDLEALGYGIHEIST